MGSVSETHRRHLTTLVRLAILGFVMGLLLADQPAIAQSIDRLYGTFSGAPKALSVTTDGYVNIVIQ